MRTITISTSPIIENWIVPDRYTVFPAIDLYFQHNKSDAENGEEDTLTVNGITFKSVFFNGVSRFYVGSDLLLSPNFKRTLTANVGEEVEVDVYFGIYGEAYYRQLPEVLFSLANVLTFIPFEPSISDFGFCVKSGDLSEQFDEIDNVYIYEVPGKNAEVWFGKIGEKPENTKVIRVIPTCTEDVQVRFLLLNGESRCWFLKIKRKISESKTKIEYNRTVETGYNNNFKTIRTEEVDNSVITTLYISGLRKNELDEISQLSVSKHATYIYKGNSGRLEIIRRSAIVGGSSQGGTFSIDVRGVL